MQHKKCKIYHSEKGLIMETEMACNKMFVVLGCCPQKKEGCFSFIPQIKLNFGIAIMVISIGMVSK
jgi:hypothetical protein